MHETPPETWSGCFIRKWQGLVGCCSNLRYDSYKCGALKYLTINYVWEALFAFSISPTGNTFRMENAFGCEQYLKECEYSSILISILIFSTYFQKTHLFALGFVIFSWIELDVFCFALKKGNRIGNRRKQNICQTLVGLIPRSKFQVPASNVSTDFPS